MTRLAAVNAVPSSSSSPFADEGVQFGECCAENFNVVLEFGLDAFDEFSQFEVEGSLSSTEPPQRIEMPEHCQGNDGCMLPVGEETGLSIATLSTGICKRLISALTATEYARRQI